MEGWVIGLWGLRGYRAVGVFWGYSTVGVFGEYQQYKNIFITKKYLNNI